MLELKIRCVLSLLVWCCISDLVYLPPGAWKSFVLLYQHYQYFGRGKTFLPYLSVVHSNLIGLRRLSCHPHQPHLPCFKTPARFAKIKIPWLGKWEVQSQKQISNWTQLEGKPESIFQLHLIVIPEDFFFSTYFTNIWFIHFLITSVHIHATRKSISLFVCFLNRCNKSWIREMLK